MNRGRAAGAMLAAGAAALAAWWIGSGPPKPAPQLDLTAQLAAARPLAADRGTPLAPRFSADGRHVAFALADDSDSRIVVQALDGSSRRFIGAAGTLRLAPVFFPDGRRIAFWQVSDGDCAIVEHDLATSAERELVDCTLTPRVRFDVAPDGRTLVFSAESAGGKPAGLWMLRLEDRRLAPLTVPPEGAGDDVHPRFSPDGRRIAFLRGREGRRQPWVLPLEAPAQARAATAVIGATHGLAWMAPEGPLLVAADWSGAARLNLLDLRDGSTRAIGAANARFPDRSPAGDLVYENVAPEATSNAGAAGGLAEAAHRPPREAGRIDLVIARR